MWLDLPENEEREIDVSIFPKIPNYRFITSSRLMEILYVHDLCNVLMNCWDERYYNFVGWTSAVWSLTRDGGDRGKLVVVMFRRLSDNVEFWFHASIGNILTIQELKKDLKS